MALLVWLYATVPIYELLHEVLRAVRIVAKGNASKKRLKITAIPAKL